MIKIVYACNDGYMDGLYLSILSIVRRTKQPIQFFLLSANCPEINPKFNLMTKKHGKILDKMIKRYNPKSSFTIINCRKEYEKYYLPSKNRKSKYSPYAAFRLFLSKYDCFSGKVIYLDTDTMACGDIKKLYDINLKNNEFAVSHDRLGRFWYRKDYFNSGVILFNIDLCRKNKLFEKALKHLLDKKMIFPDQTALYRSAKKFMYFPNEYKFNCQSPKIEPGTIIKHFCAKIMGWPVLHNIKQWDIKHVHSVLKIHIFDKDFDIYLKDKKSWH